MFPSMCEIVPEGESGEYCVEHFEISPQEAIFAETKAIYNRNYLGRMIRPGRFCRLMHIGGEYNTRTVLMSDTDAERNTNKEVVYNAHGDVLIAGLGLGMVLCPVAKKEEVRSITVIEIYQDVIDLVEPYIRKYLGHHSEKIKIICMDIFEYTPTRKFDVIYFDIWGDICGDEYPETKKLHRKFSSSLNRDGDHFMDTWVRWYMKELYFRRW